MPKDCPHCRKGTGERVRADAALVKCEHCGYEWNSPELQEERRTAQSRRIAKMMLAVSRYSPSDWAGIIDRLPPLLEIVREVAAWPCDCDHPEPGETGIVVCLACRARAALYPKEESSDD